jgi:2-polyprenyl-6-methoxyphenol hydroxylase-like FAD-dependent oxidoreductase
VHAVVIGASMAGLLAARALADSYERVTVLDRDRLPADTQHRKGVPQARHVHALLPRGREVLEELFPGLGEELVAAGASRADAVDGGQWIFAGHRYRTGRSGLEALFQGRVLLESTIRERVRAVRSVALREQCQVLGVSTTDDRSRVTGVRVLAHGEPGGEQTIPADVVVDCSGRGSRTPRWLQQLGYLPPEQDAVRVDLVYSSRSYRLPPAVMGERKAILVGTTADCPRGGAVFVLEGDRWLVTLAGMLGHVPPTDPQSFAAWAATLPVPDIAAVISGGVPLDDPVAFRFPASVRRRYERLGTLPDGLLVMGDAVCSFNPIYGQGMTVAALQARDLRHLLATGTPPVPRRFFQAVARTVDVPWQLAVGADLTIPEVPGHRTARMRLINAYIAQLHAGAEHDPAIGLIFLRVAGLLDPPSRLFTPSTMLRVLAARRAQRSVIPAEQLAGPTASTTTRP